MSGKDAGRATKMGAKGKRILSRPSYFSNHLHLIDQTVTQIVLNLPPTPELKHLKE
jgi:hypothetical protein